MSAEVFSKIEQVVMGGDLSGLTAEERVKYYNDVCHSIGLNPLTRPFEYIKLQGKLTLYARKDATEQLRKIHGISIEIVSRELADDVYVVTARARDKDGRCDDAIGAVSVMGLKGEMKANAFMRAETKSKRRVTLSIAGLGMLDETEVPQCVQTVSLDASNTPLIDKAKPVEIDFSRDLMFELLELIKKHDIPDKTVNAWLAKSYVECIEDMEQSHLEFYVNGIKKKYGDKDC